VASIAAARTNNGVGIAGVCGRCSIMPVKVLDASGAGSSSTVAAGIGWAAAHGARIINLSAATPTDDPVLDAAIASATAGGATVVLAAGNQGSTDPAAGGYPAASSPAAIRVAGIDANGALFPWSNHGSWVDIAAPGSLAAAAANGQYYLGVQGTSVAAPFVAGVAGLLLSRDPSLAPAAVKALIVANGQPVAGLDVASGRKVDAYASLLAGGYVAPAQTPAQLPTPSTAGVAAVRTAVSSSPSRRLSGTRRQVQVLITHPASCGSPRHAGMMSAPARSPSGPGSQCHAS
jgi:subtilisin family serine protease